MTRRGTLAYYLAAWVVGCFVLSVIAWAFSAPQDGVPMDPPARLLVLYFLSLLYGAPDMLVFAFLLRATMRLFKSHMLWLWIVGGGVLGTALVRLLLWSGDSLVGATASSGRGPLGYLLLVFWTAPNALRRAGIWQAPVGGALTAVVLCLVDRAFNRPGDPDSANPSPA
jgi:hypothetical protein